MLWRVRNSRGRPQNAPAASTSHARKFSEIEIYLLRATGPEHKDATGTPSRSELGDGTYDRLQGDPFIQLFFFQRAMMNGEAAKLSI